MNVNNDYNNNIHGLRGIAASNIFLYHIYQMSHAVGILQQDTLLPPLIVSTLSAGVDIFFMISGYLIVGSLIRHDDVKRFLLDRVIRIYPVFLFLHVLLFCAAPVLHYKWLADATFLQWCGHFLSNLFLLPGIFNLPAIQVVAWTLSYEAAFYLTAALLYWTCKISPIVTIILGFYVCAFFFYFYPSTIFFGVGCLYFYLDRKGYYLPHIRPIETILQCRFIQFLGTISYSFYLWHTVVTFPLKYALLYLGITGIAGVIILGLSGFILTCIISYASYLVLEKRAGIFLKNYLK